MVERRSLIDGIKNATPDPDAEKEFVYAAKAKPKVGGSTTNASDVAALPAASNLSRVPFSTRVRTDLATLIKRTSLERQLAGKTPSSLTDIVEDALSTWLDHHGHSA